MIGQIPPKSRDASVVLYATLIVELDGAVILQVDGFCPIVRQ